MKNNKIYLIGAGPGSPEYLTVKAKSVLENADIVMHDHVVSKDILALCKKATFINAGLAGYANLVHQKALANNLVSLADGANLVCRLKSGDPFLFGNGGETVEYILQACNKSPIHLELEIIPGISSGLGACASLGIPLTHTSVASSLCIISGHRQTDLPSHDYSSLAKMGTLMLYMALSNITEHVVGLLNSGMHKSVPVCIIEKGCHIDQKVTKTDLGSVLKVVETANIQEPAIFVIGNTVNHSTFI